MNNQNPFKKFLTYEERDSESFFGREQDIIGLSSLVKACPVTVCYSDSGIGKSSLINAGISPRLKKENYFPLYVLFDAISEATDFDAIIINALNNPCSLKAIWSNGLDDSDGLQYKITLSDQTKTSTSRKEDEEDTDAPGMRFYFDCCIPETDEMLLELDGELKDKSLWWFLRTRELVCEIKGTPVGVYQLLFVFDQFEELFDKCKDFESCKYFFLWFKSLASAEAPALVQEKYRELLFQYISEGKNTQELPREVFLKTLFSIRREYIGQLDYWTIQRTDTYMAAFQSNRYFLRPLSAEQAEEVITRRGSDSSLERWKSQILACAKDGNDGYASMILSVVCHELYDHGVDYAPMLEDADDPKVLGNVLLANVYADAIKATSISKRTLEKIEDDLVDEQGKRRRILTNDDSYHISRIKKADVLINELSSQGIVKRTSDETSSQTRIELVHDRLAQVVVAKRQSAKKIRTISLIRSYMAILLVVLAALTAFGAWNPGRLSTNLTKSHGHYAPGANPYHYNTKSVWKGSELEECQEYDKEAVETIIIDEPDCDIPFGLTNLQTIRTKNLDTCHIRICSVLPYLELNAKDTELKLDTTCQLIQIGDSVKTLKIDDGGYAPKFQVSPNNQTFIESEGALWYRSTKRIAYVPEGKPELFFPERTNSDTIYCSKAPYYKLLTDSIVPVITGSTLTDIPDIAKGTIDLSGYSFTKVGKEAFKNCRFIDAIILPDSVKVIEEEAFSGCSSLKRINIKDLSKLNSIRRHVFLSCTSLDTLIIPNTDHHNLYVASDAFEDCHSLKYLEYPEKIEGNIYLEKLNRRSGLTVKLPRQIGVGTFSMPYYCDINFLIDETKPSIFRKECEGLFTLRKDTTEDAAIERIFSTNKWNNFSDSIIDVFRKYYHDSTIIYNKKYIHGLTQTDTINTGGKQKIKRKVIAWNPFAADYKKICHDSYWSGTGLWGYIAVGPNEKCLVLPNAEKYVFTTNADSLKELHLKNVQPAPIEGLPDHIKQQTILYVPWHSRVNYISDSYYDAFKEIKEDSLLTRILSVVSNYIERIFVFWGANHFLLFLLILFIVAVAAIGVIGIASIMKKRKISKSVIRQKVALTALKMLALAGIGYMVSYCFCWIVVFNSTGQATLWSNVFGVIGGIGVPWLYIFCEEIDFKTFKKTVKSSPAVIKAWLKALYKRIRHIIAKHWKLLLAAALITTSTICCIKIINRMNDDIRKKLVQWESAEKQDKDSVLSVLISCAPNAHSFFCPDSLTLSYDSLITAVYDSLVFDDKISFADTLLHNDVQAFDYSQKLAYIDTEPRTRYDIKTGHTDTLSYPRYLPNGDWLFGLDCNRVKGCVYYLAEIAPDSIGIRKIEGDKDHYTDTLVSALPNDNAIEVSYARLRIAEDEKNAVIYSSSDDMVQYWNLERRDKSFERLHVWDFRCCINNDAFYFFEDWGDTLTYVPLPGDGSAHSILKTNNISGISVAEDGKLLLTNKDYKGEIGLLDIETKEFKHLLEYYCDDAIMDGGYLYLKKNGRLLRYDLNSTITTATKVEKIKDYLETAYGPFEYKDNHVAQYFLIAIIGLMPFFIVMFIVFIIKKRKAIKSTLIALATWLRVFWNHIRHFIATHWKLLLLLFAAVLIIICIICCSWYKINRTNDDVRKNLAQWESAEEQDKDSLLSVLISCAPNAHSFFCPDSLTQAYDSLITAAYDSLIYNERISFADTLLHSDVYAFDYSQKLAYIDTEPMTRYDIKTGHTDTLSYPSGLPNGKWLFGNGCDRVNGCVYYLAEIAPDSIGIRKLEGNKDHYTNTLVSALPNDNAIEVSYARLRIAEDEKNAVIYHSSGDMIQCWNLERRDKIFEPLHGWIFRCCINNDAFYFFEEFGDTLTYVPLSGDGFAHSILKTNNIYNISVAEDGKLLLPNKDYKDEIGLLDIETKEFKHLLKYRCDDAIMDGGYLYLIRNACLLRYDLNSTITTASKVEKIKDYLNAFNNQEDKKTN